MKGELLEMVEREVLGWPGVSKERGGGGRGQGGFWVPPATVYRFGRRQIGHIHDTGVADLTIPIPYPDAGESCTILDLEFRELHTSGHLGE